MIIFKAGLRQFMFILVLTTVLSVLSLPAYSGVGQILSSDLNKLQNEGAVLIDIRRPEEWKQTGVIKGSHLLTFFDRKGKYNVQQWLNEFNKIVKKDQPFVLICRSGNRTGQVSQFLDKRVKVKNVNHLSKGIKVWIKQKLPVVSP